MCSSDLRETRSGPESKHQSLVEQLAGFRVAQFAQARAPDHGQLSAQACKHLIGRRAGGANNGNGTQASTARKGEDGLGHNRFPKAERRALIHLLRL